jgi:ABC-2 type transport system permease protein
VRIYLALLAASLRAQLAYPRSLVLEAGGRFWVTGLEMVAVFVLFDHVDALAGFDRWQVVYLYGVATLSLGLAELVTDGLNEMPELVRLGTLDGLLVRPVPVLVQVLGRQCRPLHAGRALQGALALGVALAVVGPGLDAPGRIAMIPVNLAASIAVYAGLFVAEAAAVIFTVQSAEAFNAFTYGGASMSQYPVPIYRPWLRRVFLYVVPVGAACYLPALVVLGEPDPLGLPAAAPYLAPLGAGAFLAGCLGAWRLALARYTGTGS